MALFIFMIFFKCFAYLIDACDTQQLVCTHRRQAWYSSGFLAPGKYLLVLNIVGKTMDGL